MSLKKSFFILSVDGGGVRGVFAAHVLKRIEQEYAIDWRKRFDMFAGTSTGSIIVAGLVSGRSASRLINLYNETASTAFRHRGSRWMNGWLTSRYSNDALYGILKDEFGDAKLGQISNPLIIPAVDTVSGSVHVFKSGYHASFVRDKDVSVADAVMASCSAPTYFDPHVVQKYRMADGGLWANNPSLVAIADARRYLEKPLQDLKILSLGTGTAKSEYPWNENRFKRRLGWGLATRWQRKRLAELVLNLQTEAAHNMLSLLLDSAQVLRVTFKADRRLALDKSANILDLESIADRAFAHNFDKIRRFLEFEVELEQADAKK